MEKDEDESVQQNKRLRCDETADTITTVKKNGPDKVDKLLNCFL